MSHLCYPVYQPFSTPFFSVQILAYIPVLAENAVGIAPREKYRTRRYKHPLFSIMWKCTGYQRRFYPAESRFSVSIHLTSSFTEDAFFKDLFCYLYLQIQKIGFFFHIAIRLFYEFVVKMKFFFKCFRYFSFYFLY